MKGSAAEHFEELYRRIWGALNRPDAPDLSQHERQLLHHIPADGVISTRKFVSERHETALAYLRGYVRGLRFLRANADESKRVLSKYTKQEDPLVLPILALLHPTLKPNRIVNWGVHRRSAFLGSRAHASGPRIQPPESTESTEAKRA